MYEFLLTVHVLGAVVWVGGNIAMHIIGRRTLARGDKREIFEFSKEINLIAMRLYAPTSVILLVAGIFLVHRAGYEFSQAWVVIGLLGWVFSFIVGVGYYGPQDKKLQALVAAEGSEAPGVVQNVRQALAVNFVELLILVGVIVAMTSKPGV